MEKIHQILWNRYGIEAHFRGVDFLIVGLQKTCIEVRRAGNSYDVRVEGSNQYWCFTAVGEVVAYCLGVLEE